MAESKSNGGGSADTLITPMPGEMHPRGILQAISYQQVQFVNEKGGCIIDPDYFTPDMQWEFQLVGAKTNFVLAPVAAFLIPLVVAAIDKNIPVFGTTDLTWFHKFSVIMLAMAFYLGYAFFIASSAMNYLGPYTYKMAKATVGGAAIGALTKGVPLFIIYHLIYISLSDAVIMQMATFVNGFGVSYEKTIIIYQWLLGLKKITLNSAYFIAVATLLYIAIPYLAMLWAHFRNRRWIESGIVEVHSDDEW